MNMPLFDLYSTVRGGGSNSNSNSNADYHSETEFLNPQQIHSLNSSPNLSPNPSPVRDPRGRNRSQNRWRNPRFHFTQNRHQHFYNSPNQAPPRRNEYPYQLHEPSPTPSTRSEIEAHLDPQQPRHTPPPPLFPLTPSRSNQNRNQSRSPYQNRQSFRGGSHLVPPSGSGVGSRTRSPLPLPVPFPVPAQFQSSASVPPPILPPLLPPFGDWNQNSILNSTPKKSLLPHSKSHASSNFPYHSHSNPNSNSNGPSHYSNLGVALTSATQTAQTFLAGNPNFNYQTTMPLDLIRHRRIAQIISVIDAVFATGLLVFHGLTLMVQEMPEKSDDGVEAIHLLPKIPLTPGELNITGYMEVIAWIAILSVNAIQLLVAISLFNASDKKRESLKAFEASRVWLKTCVFLLIILLIKLCILYFMYEMNMKAPGTIITTGLETLFHIVGLIIVFKFFEQIKKNNPQLHDQLEEEEYVELNEEEENKKKNDAVWC